MFAAERTTSQDVIDEASECRTHDDVLVHALDAVLGKTGHRLSCVRVHVEAIPETTWENGASLRLFCGVDDVQDFAVFAGQRGATAMLRSVFDGGPAGEISGEDLRDGLAETLNQVVGHLKNSELADTGDEPTLDTPEFLEQADAENYAHVHPTAAVFRITSDAWLGEAFFMASPKRQRSIAALEQAIALLIRGGLERGTTIRACRLLEVVRTPVLALTELPSMGITLSWCVENLAVLVNGVSGFRERAVFHRVLGELESLRAALVRLTASPEATAFVIPSEEDVRSLLRDFCRETLAGVERTRLVLSSCTENAPASPFGLMHTVQVTAGFLHLEQLQRLALETGRLIGSVRASRAKMADDQIEAVRHSLLLIEGWVEALSEALDGEGIVAWSPELEGHTRMLEHVLECGGRVVVHAAGAVASHDDVSVGHMLQLDQSQLSRLEALQTELREWAALSRSEGEVRCLAEPGEFFDRADQELVSICRSVRRTPMGPVLARLARHCREASARHRKLVRVDASGDSLDAPAHLMSAMAGPLVHLVNNAILHGVEDTAERGRQGKKVLALVQLRAERSEGSLTLEVADDGRGIPPETLREHGKKTRTEVEGPEGWLGDIYQLYPRSSTLPQGQELSGLDAVVREVEAVGGVVEVASAEGRGTRVRIVLRESVGAESEADEDEFSDLQESGELTFF